jgi:membrane protease YdiL (CAAX protease family)
MQVLSLAFDIILAGYVAWEVARMVPRYRQLKQAVAAGDTGARTRMYYHALTFEWVSALLALIALGFNWTKLNPRFLSLAGNALIRPFSSGGDLDRGMITGLAVDLVGGTIGFIVARLRANRRGVQPAADAPARWWRKLLPDFTALIPVTARERLLWSAAAISAGVCEETVFRGWLLAILHSRVGLGGTALVLTAAAIFGLAHTYQGITGVVLTAIAGILFCVLYVVTGSLLVPIVLHSLVDLRFAFLPAPRVRKPEAVYALSAAPEL